MSPRWRRTFGVGFAAITCCRSQSASSSPVPQSPITPTTTSVLGSGRTKSDSTVYFTYGIAFADAFHAR